MNKLRFLTCCSAVFLTLQVIAQNKIDGLYTNSNDEFVCFNEDTIRFRIFNYDCCNTYAIGKGIFIIDKKGNILIKKLFSIYALTSIVDQYQDTGNKTIITILEENNSPEAGIVLRVKNVKHKKYDIFTTSDTNGNFYLREEQIQQLDNKIFVRVEGNSITEQVLSLQRGYHYVIKSVIPEKISSGIIVSDRKQYNFFIDNNQLYITFKDLFKDTHSTVVTKLENVSVCSDLLYRNSVDTE